MNSINNSPFSIFLWCVLIAHVSILSCWSRVGFLFTPIKAETIVAQWRSHLSHPEMSEEISEINNYNIIDDHLSASFCSFWCSFRVIFFSIFFLSFFSSDPLTQICIRRSFLTLTISHSHQSQKGEELLQPVHPHPSNPEPKKKIIDYGGDFLNLDQVTPQQRQD